VLSDLEVEVEENVTGELYEFAYPVDDCRRAKGADASSSSRRPAGDP